ncbi:RecB-like helicase [Campylobacter sputorum]|uniref:RecB-like helicase n=1 Tax=Campylobacter sputorum TaxID=206 RepID=UPI001E5D9917|nr:RecB-like helicase [Campylobacter sputorum]
MIDFYEALGASAGSGKTFKLSVRYIALVLMGRDMRKILAITFTKKATNEMKTRISQTFLNLHTKKAELNEICKLLNKSEQEIINLRDKAKERFLSSELRIQTFDAFFSSILRLFSLNLGLMPDFEITDSLYDETTNILVQNANDNLIKKIASYIKFSGDNQLEFFETINAIYENLNDINFVNNVNFPNDQKILQNFQDLKTYAITLSSNARYINLFDKNIKDFILNVDLEKNYFQKIKDDKKFMEKFETFMDSAKDYFEEFEAYKLKELFEIVKRYKLARFELNKNKNLLSFTDISKLTYELTNTQNYREMLYFRLDSKITDILIDEFQDTNVLQYNIIKPLIEECISGIGQNGIGSFFYVGDIKQSIYRFRGGKKELFDKLKSDYKQIKFSNLDTNYRSDKCLVEFVNDTFKNVIKNYAIQKPNNQDDGYIEICSCEKEKIYEKILDKVNFLKSHNIPENQIAILCWKNNDIENIKTYLQNNDIKAVSQSSVLIINSKYVRILIEYAKFCYFNDNYYLYNLQAFYDEAPSKIEINFNLNLKDTLYKMAKELKLDFSDKNMLRFFEIVGKYENFIQFILNIENEKEKSINEAIDGVNLLSVHSSKGLEFKHVIVVDMIGKENNRSPKFLFEYDISNNNWEIRLNDKVFEKLDSKFVNLKTLSKTLDDEDKINQIYVAFTRAKNSLIIIAKSDANGNSPSLFKKYISNKQEVKILDLEDKIIGNMGKFADTKANQIQEDEKINFININRQNLINLQEEKELNFKSALFGTALHFMIEMMNQFDEENLQNAYIILENRHGSLLDENELKDIKNRVKMLIKNEKFLNLLQGFTLLKEQDYTFESVLKRVDLLAINENSREILIFDYKSSKNFFNENVSQVKEYIANLENIYPKYKINGYLVFLLQNGSQIELV